MKKILIEGNSTPRRCVLCGGAKDVKAFKSQGICPACIDYVKTVV